MGLGGQGAEKAPGIIASEGVACGKAESCCCTALTMRVGVRTPMGSSPQVGVGTIRWSSHGRGRPCHGRIGIGMVGGGWGSGGVFECFRMTSPEGSTCLVMVVSL